MICFVFDRVRLADVFISLYRNIHVLLKPSSVSTFLWMMTLPLYWTIVHHGGDHARLLLSRNNGGHLYKRSMLPFADNLSWYKLNKDCETFGLQKYSVFQFFNFQVVNILILGFVYFLPEIYWLSRKQFSIMWKNFLGLWKLFYTL